MTVINAYPHGSTCTVLALMRRDALWRSGRCQLNNANDDVWMVAHSLYISYMRVHSRRHLHQNDGSCVVGTVTVTVVGSGPSGVAVVPMQQKAKVVHPLQQQASPTAPRQWLLSLRCKMEKSPCACLTTMRKTRTRAWIVRRSPS